MKTWIWHNWTPQEDRLIVTSGLPDKVLGRLIGCSAKAVNHRRCQRRLGPKAKVQVMSTRKMAQHIIAMRNANGQKPERSL